MYMLLLFYLRISLLLMSAYLYTNFFSDRGISCCARTIYRRIYAMCDTRLLHRALAGTTLRKFQPILHVPSAISNFNYHLRIHCAHYFP